MGLLARYQRPVRAMQRAADPLVAVAALFALLRLHHVPLALHWEILAVLAPLVVLVVFDAAGAYRPWRAATLDEELKRLWIAWTGVAGVLLALGYSTKTGALFSRRVVLTWLVAAPLAITAFHLVVRIALRVLRAHGRNTKRYVVVGGGDLARRVHEKILSVPWLGMRGSGTFHDGEGEVPGLPRLGGLADVGEFVRREGTNHVYVALPMSDEARIREVVEALSDSTASVYLVPDIFTFQLLGARIENIDGLPVIGLRDTPFAGVEGWVKRVEDVVVASLVLALVSPLLALIAVGVKLTSPGPVLFKQRRYGLDGRPIRVYKFRSMTCCEDGDTVRQASREDARVTRFGALLRQTSLDELPQFWNVLQGRMSIVGPRPHAVAHNEHYRRLIKGYMLRHKVRPGITGLAQVNGFRGETETLDKMEKRVEYDLAYIEQWSLALDLRIILQTVLKGFGSPAAY